MPRLHLFEFEDLSWFPKSFRDYGTDFLQFVSNKTKLWKPAIPLLSNLLQECNTSQIVDLASGGGGGLLWLNSELQKTHPDLKFVLTDFYPNLSAFEYTKLQADNFEFIAAPIDAREVPAHLKGIRTQFLSLHHFRPKDAQKILQNAVDHQQAIALFEGQERSIPSILAMLFSPITVLLTTPFIRPFKWGRIFFTYLIPIVPLFVLWDGLVSSLRTYSIKEMEALVASVPQNDSFTWKIGREQNGPGIFLYLIGSPKNKM